jgi:uncharacterized protein YuzE
VEEDMSRSVRITLDEENDVLYVRVGDPVALGISRLAPHDPELVLNTSSTGDVIGIQLLGAMQLVGGGWRAHPDRDLLPTELRDAVDGWMLTRAK